MTLTEALETVLDYARDANGLTIDERIEHAEAVHQVAALIERRKAQAVARAFEALSDPA